MKERNGQPYTTPGNGFNASSQQHVAGGISGNYAPGMVNQEWLQADPVLESILGPILGDLTPFTSTSNDHINRSTSDSFSSCNTPAVTAEPSPIQQGLPTQICQPITPRMLFQDEDAPTEIPLQAAGQTSSTVKLTPTKQQTLDKFFNRRDRKTRRSDMSICEISSSQSVPQSYTATSLARSPVEVVRTPQKRKGQQSTRNTPGTPSPKQRKQTPNKTPNKTRDTRTDFNRRRQRNNDSNNEAFSSPSESEDEQQESLSSKRTVPHFSIHKLPITHLLERFKNIDLTEIEMIENTMKDVNEDIIRRYKYSREIFEQRCVTTQERDEIDMSNNEATTSQQANTTFNFKVVVYLQRVKYEIPMLSQLGISDKTEDINTIVFYYRRGDIYALTNRQTWQAIQRFCCYKFPYQISGRLTSSEGNVEETTKPLVGIIRTSKSTKKNATVLDQLNNVTLNVIKEVREHSSLFGLQEFKPDVHHQRSPTKGGSVGQVKMQIGFAYVRIKKRIDLKNLPEILDHFSKICNSEKTYKYPDGPEEKHIDESPPLRLVPRDEAKLVESSLYELIHKFMHNQHKSLIRKFDFVDKHVDDFCNAEEFIITYRKGEIATFTSCPTALQVLTVVRAKCQELTTNNISLEKFSNRLRKHLMVQYETRGNTRERRVVELLEGEMSLYDKNFWKIMGQWWSLKDKYYYNIDKQFLDLLTKPNVYLNCEYLSKPWDKNRIKTVQEYVQLYYDEDNYFLPPNWEEMQAMGSQTMDPPADGDDETTNSTIGDHFFDMMRIAKQEDGNCAFWLFYIFDSFDASIRDASTRITKSIDMLLKDNPTTSTTSLLEKFYEHYVNRNNYFKALFPKFEHFHQPITKENKVNIVVAFATEPRLEETGPLKQHALSREENIVSPTLDREKNLKLDFNLEIIEQILNEVQFVSQEHVVKMCMELEILTDSESFDMELLASKVFGLLETNGYCEDRKDNVNVSVTGKLLKIRHWKELKLFKSDDLNKVLFEKLRKYYITGFPGFIHKLEFLQIFENVGKEVRLNLSFTEIRNTVDSLTSISQL